MQSIQPTNWFKSSKCVDQTLVATLLITCALVLSKNFSDPDLWGHVRYGQDLLQSGLPETSTYTYTAVGHRWINHENVAEVLMACAVASGKPQTLLVVKVVLGVVLMTLIVRSALQIKTAARGKPADPPMASLSLLFSVLLVATNLMYFWDVRPQLFSYMLFALMLCLLNFCFRDWRDHWHLSCFGLFRGKSLSNPREFDHGRLRWLWLAPPLFAIWANTHGAFVAGYAVFVVYLACRVIEATDSQMRRRWLFQFGLIVLVSGLATLINPYGWELHTWLLKSLGSARPEIIEWRPPELNTIWLQYWIMIGMIVISLVYSRRPRDFTQMVIICLVAWQSIEHRRHIPLLAILVGFWLLPHFDSLLNRLRLTTHEQTFGERMPAAHRPIFVGVLAVVCLIVLSCVYNQTKMFPVRKDTYPVSALQFMADHDLKGKLVVRFMWAQYALAAFADEADPNAMKLAFDGRFRTCYPQQIVDMYFDWALGDDPHRNRAHDAPPIDESRLLEHHLPDLVLVDRSQEPAIETVRQSGNWTLLYQDELAQLWGRRTKYDDPALPDYVPVEDRRITNTKQEGTLAWPAFPTRQQDARDLRAAQAKTVAVSELINR